MKARIIFALLLVAGCDGSGGDAAPAGAAEKPKGATGAVDVVPVVSQRLEMTTRLPAEIYAYESVALYPRVNGFVEDVLVDRGSAVHKGQLLARLTAPELIAQRAEAESKLAAARSTFERTRAAADTPGAIAKHDLEIADAALKADEARVQSLKTLEGYLLVRAPFDGMVTERSVHPGALVGPPTGGNATPMLRMESVGHLRVTVAVPESDVGAIADGAKVDFVVRTWPGTRFSGVIRRIAHAVDPKTRTMPIELDFDNREGKLAPGQFADVTWPVRRPSPTLFVPLSAVVQSPDKTFVDRVKDDVVEQVQVQRGTVLKDTVEVFGPLQAGDLVLKRGSEELKNGATVKTKPAAAGDERGSGPK